MPKTSLPHDPKIAILTYKANLYYYVEPIELPTLPTTYIVVAFRVKALSPSVARKIRHRPPDSWPKLIQERQFKNPQQFQIANLDWQLFLSRGLSSSWLVALKFLLQGHRFIFNSWRPSAFWEMQQQEQLFSPSNNFANGLEEEEKRCGKRQRALALPGDAADFRQGAPEQGRREQRESNSWRPAPPAGCEAKCTHPLPVEDPADLAHVGDVHLLLLQHVLQQRQPVPSETTNDDHKT